jgi:hypothetical protein
LKYFYEFLKIISPVTLTSRPMKQHWLICFFYLYIDILLTSFFICRVEKVHNMFVIKITRMLLTSCRLAKL